MLLTGEEEIRARKALHLVEDAARELDEARTLLLLRAEVALAAGADESAVCRVAG